MKKIAFVAVAFLFALSLAGPVLALDPVAPKSERTHGYIRIVSPQATDTCQLLPLGKSSTEPACRVEEMFQVPIGQYLLKVRMQDGYTWETQTAVEPTEFTKVNVIGFGNIKMSSPSPSSDKVEVYTQEGKLIKTFNTARTQTLPTGTYNLKVYLGRAQTKFENVQVYTNTTTELGVSQ